MSGPFPAPRDGHHVVIFVVDVSTSEEFLEHIKLAVSAALEVLPPHTLVGLISAADHVRRPFIFRAFPPPLNPASTVFPWPVASKNALNY